MKIGNLLRPFFCALADENISRWDFSEKGRHFLVRKNIRRRRAFWSFGGFLQEGLPLLPSLMRVALLVCRLLGIGLFLQDKKSKEEFFLEVIPSSLSQVVFLSLC